MYPIGDWCFQPVAFVQTHIFVTDDGDDGDDDGDEDDDAAKATHIFWVDTTN